MRPIRARSRKPTGVVTSMRRAARAPPKDRAPASCRASTLCDGPAHGGGGIDRHDLAGHQPVEQVADRGEALLDGRRGSLAAELLDVGGDVQRLHVGDRRDAGALAPGQKFPRRLARRRGACACCGSERRRIRGSAFARRRPPRRRGPGQTDQPGRFRGRWSWLNQFCDQRGQRRFDACEARDRRGQHGPGI